MRVVLFKLFPPAGAYRFCRFCNPASGSGTAVEGEVPPPLKLQVRAFVPKMIPACSHSTPAFRLVPLNQRRLPNQDAVVPFS